MGELKKADAVRKEDFLVAMDIKKQISQLINNNSSSASVSAESETKQQEFDDYPYKKTCDNTCDQFSLFTIQTKPVDYKIATSHAAWIDHTKPYSYLLLY